MIRYEEVLMIKYSYMKCLVVTLPSFTNVYGHLVVLCCTLLIKRLMRCLQQDQDSVNIPCEHTTGDTSEYVTKLTVSNGRQHAPENYECESNSSQSETDTTDKTWILNNNTNNMGANSSGNPAEFPSGVKARAGAKSVTMTGPIGPVHIEWSGSEREEHHYQNFATMMQHQRTRNISRLATLLSQYILRSYQR